MKAIAIIKSSETTFFAPPKNEKRKHSKTVKR
jgi:hypothetical protein